MLGGSAANTSIGSVQVGKEISVDGHETDATRINRERLLHPHLPGVAVKHFDDPRPLWLVWPAQNGCCIEGRDSGVASDPYKQPLAVHDMKRRAGAVWILSEGKQAIDKIAWRVWWFHDGISSLCDPGSS